MVPDLDAPALATTPRSDQHGAARELDRVADEIFQHQDQHVLVRFHLGGGRTEAQPNAAAVRHGLEAQRQLLEDWNTGNESDDPTASTAQ